MRALALVLTTLCALPALAEESSSSKKAPIELPPIDVSGDAHKPGVLIVLPRNPEAKRAVDSAGGDSLERATERAR